MPKIRITDVRNGYPAVGTEMDVSDDRAARWCGTGIAALVLESAKAPEPAPEPAPNPEEKKGKK